MVLEVEPLTSTLGGTDDDLGRVMGIVSNFSPRGVLTALEPPVGSMTTELIIVPASRKFDQPAGVGSRHLLQVSLTIFKLVTRRSPYSSLPAAFSIWTSFLSSAFDSR
jgi:hypothetical protein